METEVQNDMFKHRSSILADNSIERKQLVSYIPLSKADFNTSTRTIVINIPASDTYYLPSKRFLKIKGRIVGDNNNAYDANAQIALTNNAMMYLFSSIEYSLGGKKMETLSYPGHTTSMLGYVSYPDDFNSSAGLNQCWRKDTNVNAISAKYTASPAVAADAAIAAGLFTPQENPNYNEGFASRRKLLMDNDTPGEFSFSIPFSHMFGFAEYNKVLYNLQHTLKLVRASDNLAIHKANNVDEGKILLTDIRWVIPEIEPSTEMKTVLREYVANRTKFPINFSSRNDEHIEVPDNARSLVQNINISAGVEKPRWVIIGLQTDKTNTQEQNPAVFDHINVTSASVKLNGKRYPEEDTNVNFGTNDYVDFCEMADEFKKEYYEFNNVIGGTQIDMLNYKSYFH